MRLCLAISFFLAPMVLHAQSEREIVKELEKPIRDYNQYFSSIDVDRNGRISLDEIYLAAETRHSGVDRDGDRKITINEYQIALPNLTRGAVESRFSQTDKNRDGLISVDESREASRSILQFDMDRSGDLTFKEVMVMAPPAVRRYYEQKLTNGQ